VGWRHDRGRQRHDHELENLNEVKINGVRSTLISNEWNELGRGADDFWYSSMRMPPSQLIPFIVQINVDLTPFILTPFKGLAGEGGFDGG
jgi:hypothetical protein